MPGGSALSRQMIAECAAIAAAHGHAPTPAVMAQARASAASDFIVLSAKGNRRCTMNSTWSLSARPAPTTDFLMSSAAYSATDKPAFAGASMAAGGRRKVCSNRCCPAMAACRTLSV